MNKVSGLWCIYFRRSETSLFSFAYWIMKDVKGGHRQKNKVSY